MNILIIEDDEYFASQIKKTFLSQNFANRVTHICSFKQYVLSAYTVASYDIVLLDVNLSEQNDTEWFKILSDIRKRNTNIPVIIISSHCEYSFLEEAFNSWANDYIIKPFRTRELQIRIQRWFRNYVLSEYFTVHKTLKYHELLYDMSTYEFYIWWKKLSLWKGNKYILSLFLIHREDLVRQDYFIEKIWWHSERNYDKNLRIKIMRLRKKLEFFWCWNWIHTIRGEWYIFKKP